mgnify:CR=1 FL=1
MVSISVIFLFRPEYFIDDIKSFIEYRLPSSIVDEVNIGSIEGNFITGFRVTDISYKEDNKIVFSAQEIYIDPDLSQIILGTIALSKVVINNSYYNHDYSIIGNQRFNAPERNFFSFNYEITSLNLNNAIIVFMENMYDLNGELTFRYNDEYQIQLSNIVAQSINFPSKLRFLDGVINLHENEVIVSNLIAKSKWFSGSMNGIYNLVDINQTSGMLVIENFEYGSEGRNSIVVNELTAKIENQNDTTSIIIKTNIEYQDIILSDLQMNGRLEDEFVMIDSSFMEIDGEKVRIMGNYLGEKRR